METAVIEMKRKFLSSEKYKFECYLDGDYKAVFRPNAELYIDERKVFSQGNGIDKFLYNQQDAPVRVEYEGRTTLIMHLNDNIKLMIIHVESGFCKAKYQVMLNDSVIGTLLFSSSFFPYTEKYQLVNNSNEKKYVDLLLFSLFAWYSHETICTL